MRGRFLSFLLISCISPIALCQGGASPPPASGQTDAATAPQLVKRPPEPPEAWDASGRPIDRITLDLNVTDATGEAAKGLDARDFTLLDNQKPAKILSFQAIDGASTAADPVQVILLVDTVNNTFESVAAERDQITKFLSRNGGQLPVPMSIALFSDSGIKIDQPTLNGNLLIAELKKMPIPVRAISAAAGGEGAAERFQISHKALLQLLAYEGTKPGRKLLIWIGPGWPMLSVPRVDVSDAEKRSDWSSIVLFSTDLRETRTTLYSVDSLSSETALSRSVFYQNFLKPVTSEKDASAGYLALPVLAMQSGGKVLYGSNDLAGEIADCVNDALAYYTVSLQISPSQTLDEYHALQAKVAQPALTARTSAGYYNQPFGSSRSLPQSASPVETLRKEGHLVIVDAVVLDRHGSPVKGLKIGDLQLKEDGVPQKLASLEENSPETSVVAPPQLSADGTITVSNTPSNRSSVWNVLLVDTLNTPKEDLASLRKQLQQFANQLPASEPVALVTMSSQSKIVTSFHEDAAAISQYLKKNGLPVIGSAPPVDIDATQEELEIQPSPQMLANKAEIDVERQDQRAQQTLDNFSAIAKWLRNYPGRKNVYWLSAGFPLQGQPFGILGHTEMSPTGPAAQSSQTNPMQKSTDKELESARVAIYPIDVRGVAPPDIAGETTADTTGDFLTMGKLGDKSIDAKKDDQLKAAQQTEMLDIAHVTGGAASFNNNLADALRKDFNQGENYYTLSYTPSNPAWNGTYRRISLSTNEPGDQLLYRQGYYATDPQSEPAPTAGQFRTAMQHGAPPESSVLFSAKVNKSADALNVEYAIQSRTIQYPPDPSGKLVANIDCALLEFDVRGKILASSLIGLTTAVAPEMRAALNSGVIHTKQSIALKPEAASVVLGVRDQSTGLFGTLEVALATH